MTPAGTSNERDVQNEWEENTHTHMEGTSCLISFRMVFLYLVTTDWIFDIIRLLCKNSINQSYRGETHRRYTVHLISHAGTPDKRQKQITQYILNRVAILNIRDNSAIEPYNNIIGAYSLNTRNIIILYLLLLVVVFK